MNALLLSIIFVGIGFVIPDIEIIASVVLCISSIFIIASIGVLAHSVVRDKKVKEISVGLEGGIEPDKEKEIISSLIKVYNISQNHMITQYETRSKRFELSVKLLIGGLVFLLGFILYVGGMQSFQTWITTWM